MKSKFQHSHLFYPERHSMKHFVTRFGRYFFWFLISAFCLFLFCGKPDRHVMALIKAKGKIFKMGETGIAKASSVLVTLDHNYYMDRTEITEGFYTSIMGNDPSLFKGDTARPVENVSFIDAAQFCNRRSIAERLEPCYAEGAWMCDRTKNGYRLPTEAEWEYACRGKCESIYFWGSKVSPRYCWYKANSSQAPHPVATKKPNKFGLYDMSGNVWEWCDDRYLADRQISKPTHWELGPKTLRGGSWSSTPELLGSAVRDAGDPFGKSNGVGFRCVKNY
jgi:formylglycine-generating enzyme required for sulfatase activity